jgi:zinc transport system substrate-binding protein
MQINYRHIIAFLLILATLNISCSDKAKNENKISVSILPQKYLVERICGNEYIINVLIPPGENPATCELTSKQIKTLLKSKLYFSIGFLPYETTHIKNVLEENNSVTHINLSDSIILIKDMIEHGNHHHEGGIDPHIWTSPSNVMHMCKNIYKHLCETYPEDADSFTGNYNELIADIASLDVKIANTLENKTNRNFLIYHPTLTYLARDYGLNQIAIEYEGKSPSPKYLKEIIETARQTNTKIVFVQKQFDTKKAEFIAKEINGKIIPIDPLNENWLEEMYLILNALDNNLE